MRVATERPEICPTWVGVASSQSTMWQAAIALLGAFFVLTGCGSSERSGEASYGTGADEVWVFRPATSPPRSVVVFVHGHGGPGEDTPQYHRPWLRHLAAGGSAVLYPRYEFAPGGHDAVSHIANAVRAGMEALGDPSVPAVGIGYSRGGRLVMDWAARAAGTRFEPSALLSVSPASEELTPEESDADR